MWFSVSSWFHSLFRHGAGTGVGVGVTGAVVGVGVAGCSVTTSMVGLSPGPGEVVSNTITLEVGMGVVPMDAGERIWRERVGRTCSMLASQATRVVRMVCGIPTIIKDGDIA